MRIREVVKETGVAKELIHHYLRQKLLPKSTSRARYTDRQVRLLHQIKKLREDHHLPLHIIRRVFEFFKFDPAHLESLTLGDSLGKRMTRLAQGGDILSTETLSSDDLLARSAVSTERLADYVQAKLVQPVAENGRERFSVHDATTIALCERGVELGIPFESFRTIASYVRVAFELEQSTLFEVPRAPGTDEESILGEVFVRREVVNRFIQNLLEALISHRVRDVIALGLQEGASLDGIIYRPSPIFVRHHALDGRTEAAQEALCASPEAAGLWLSTGRLMLHAGRYHEAAFFLEQTLERWPSAAAVRGLYGRALILSGQADRGCKVLEQVGGEPGQDGPGTIFLALSMFARFGGGAGADALVSNSVRLLGLLDEALIAAQYSRPAERFEVQMLAGWILTALPAGLRDEERGMMMLAETLEELIELEEGALAGEEMPGLRERYLINTAYLLFDSMNRCESGPTGKEGAGSLPSAEDLKSLIYRLDPGCAFAEKVFLAEDDKFPTGGGP